MPHEHVTVTLDAETVERIEADLEGGETVAAWLRDAAHRRLDGGPEGGDGEGEAHCRAGVEFVDDCFL